MRHQKVYMAGDSFIHISVFVKVDKYIDHPHKTRNNDVRFQVLTAPSMKFRIVFCLMIPDDGGSTHL
jgi:hypothetical protein